ncbi:hypothetical protein [Azoarcus sp. DN11]|uniref:IS66 family insertion sequence element accessory protein TnpA n=1 Tax=Azoarcus sp. DN11 TaxID=356837 RepID=UPI000EAD5FBD|nr:hypothetical protein [Azoarcus sp. DN11]AYH43206.1 hypothetical protein CDA09_07365 [Azoarcus sp. DN11]
MEGRLVSDGEGGIGTAVGRIDWRTGKRMMARDDTFWQQHETLRREQGLSIPQYCEVNGLALSTFRHRVGRLVRTGAGVEPASRAKSKSADARGQFIALPHGVDAPSLSAEIEVRLPGTMTLHLQGAAAQQVLDRILAQLP